MNFYTQQLAASFSSVIEQAWRYSPKIDNKAGSEPNHVARFIHGAPGGLAHAIKQVKGVAGVSVAGVFCHRSPYARWLNGNALTCCELADLMIQISITGRQTQAERAILIQTKMGMPGTSTWAPGLSLSVDPTQRKLYSTLPTFSLQTANKASKKVAATGSTGLSTYDLSANPLSSPVGLAYAAIDRERGRTGVNLQPWLIEVERPRTETKACFSESFAWALAEMVSADDANNRFGLRTASSMAQQGDWTKLIADLDRWAHARSIQAVAGKKTLDVSLVQGQSPNDVFHNVQTFVATFQDSFDFVSWGHSSTDVAEWPATAWPAVAPATPAWVKNSWHKFARLHGERRLLAEGSPPEWRNNNSDKEPTSHFGSLKIMIDLEEG